MTSASAIDVAILIALPEEFRTLAADYAKHWEHRPSRHHPGNDFFFTGPGGYRCVAAISPGMGPTIANHVANALLAHHPAALVNVGIAGGFTDDIRIGDVTVPPQVDAYDETGKMSGDQAQWTRRNSAYRPTPTLVAQVRELEFTDNEAFAAWTRAGREGLEALESGPHRDVIAGLVDANLLRREPIMGTRSMLASGSFVVASKTFAEFIRKANTEVHAGEMEAAGMLTAAEFRPEVVPTLVLRGISDHVDADKKTVDSIGEGSLRRLAMANAWRLLTTLMEQGRLPRQQGDAPSEPPDAQKTVLPCTLTGVSAMTSIADFLAQARSEQWDELALGRTEDHCGWLRKAGWNPDRMFVLGGQDLDLNAVLSCTRVEALALVNCCTLGEEGARGLAALTGLTSLNLWDNSIGEEGAQGLATLTGLTSLDLMNNNIGERGARALATLTGLTSLDLTNNNIRDEGARALATLTGLTSLTLTNNRIGNEGAQALATLTGLTSLELWDNSIGDEGARALAGLTSLTSLDLWDNSIGNEGARALARLTGLTSLNLINNSIGDEGARALAALTGLTALSLTNNSIGDEGARALATLTGLTFLNLTNNSIGDEGAQALARLTGLTSLHLTNNSIGAEGAQALARLTGLTALNLMNNSIGDEGARGLASLTGLTYLDLMNNSIGDEGARGLASLTGLTSLNLTNNSIGDEGAQALARLTGLTSLNLMNNRVRDEGARALARLTGLTSLNLWSNGIGDEGARALLEGWRAGSDYPDKLRHLWLSGNNITFLPQEILETSDAQAIFAAYRRYQASPSEPLNEAKLLVVGQEAVGKTSLIRYLTLDKPRNPDEEKTPGIAAHQRIETQTWSPTDQAPLLNVWDFGGQEILHETHKFFLTERSIYLLVLEDRREDDTSIFKWLRTISNRGGDSPIIVVINKCDDSQPKLLLDETSICRDWPSVVGFVRTSCNPGEPAAGMIDALKAKILDTLQHDARLRHVRDPLPTPWRRVKDSVAELAEKDRVLTHFKFIQLCERPEGPDAITDENEQRALLQLLHNLGVIVAHGLSQDAPAALRNVRLLDPNWLTGAIYKVLTAGLVVHQEGVFRREQLAELLDPKDYPTGRWEFILEMMQLDGMGLCFPLSGSTLDEYLVPEALPKNAPNYENWPKDSLRFRFKYEFLPVGLVPRFIVEAHALPAKTRWRTGAVLEAAECSVLVSGNPRKRCLDIQVDGPKAMRRAALAVVLEHLERVHVLNPEAKPSAEVPLPDNPEVTVSYKHLRRLEELEGPAHRFLPEKALRRYNVSELLDGVRTRQLKEDTDPVVAQIRAEDSELPSPDVLLVVSRDVEFDAVNEAAKAITGRDFALLNGKRLVYYDLGSIAEARIFVVETEVGTAGPGGSLSCISSAISELRLGSTARRTPASVVAVGLAFGVDEAKQKIGDVLVSSQLRTYDLKRAGKDEVIPRGNRVPASTTLVSRMRAANKRLRHIRVRRGLVLSCDTMVNNLDDRESLKELVPEAIGGEMEGSGLHTACRDGGVQWLLVKAICDWGDGYKVIDKHARQKLAAKNAAELVFTALQGGGFKR